MSYFLWYWIYFNIYIIKGDLCSHKVPLKDIRRMFIGYSLDTVFILNYGVL